MAFILGNRIREVSTTTGTGALTLAGAILGFASFDSVLNTGDTTWYTIAMGADWEVGLGTFTAPATLARTQVLASSNNGAAVSFGAGDKDVFITAPAAALQTLPDMIRKDGTATITADIPFNGKKITGLGDAAAATDAMNRQASDARYLLLANAADILLSSGTIVSAAASLTVALPAGYTDYEFLISDLAPVTNATQLYMIVSTDNAASFYNSSSNYAYGGFTCTSGNATPTLAAFGTGGGSISSAFLLSGAFSNSGTSYSQFRVNIATAYTGNNSLIATGAHENSTAAQTTYIVNTGILGAAARITHIRLFLTSGNLAGRGKWSVRGRRS